MFTKLTFQNLRCFKDFTLENITPLTLISGRNNVGKTTVLEGIFFLMAYRTGEVFFNINNIRGMGLTIPAQLAPFAFSLLDPSYLWETLFTDQDMKQALNIAMEDDNGLARRLSLAKDEQFSFTTFAEQNKMQPMLPPAPGSYALRFSYQYNGSEEHGRFIFAQNGLMQNFDAPPHLSPPPFAVFIGSNMYPQQQAVAEWLGKVEQENKKEQLVQALRLLYDQIEDIFIVPRQGVNLIFARLQSKESLPIRVMGDGINKLLLYLTVMIANPGGIFLLDEIETGFHYSFYAKLWELVAMVAKETGGQVFATTHSYECINTAYEGTSRVDPTLLTYVRLGKEDEGITPYSFSKDDLAYALEREMEVR